MIEIAMETIIPVIKNIVVRSGIESNRFEAKCLTLFPLFGSELRFISIKEGGKEDSMEGLSEEIYRLRQEITEGTERDENKTKLENYEKALS